MARQVVITDDLEDHPTHRRSRTASMVRNLRLTSLRRTRRSSGMHSPFVKKSRPLERQAVIPSSARSGTRRKSSAGGGNSGRSDIGNIRPWAQAQGMKVAGRGRIKKEIIDAYDEAHK